MMKSFLSLLLLLAVEPVHGGVSSQTRQWLSLDMETEFQPAEVPENASAQTASRLRAAQHRFLGRYANKLVDGAETAYDEYGQAWRYLGYYVDCNEDADMDGNDEDDDGNQQDQEACVRYLLWAAYVDLDYSGNGLSEYQFYDIDEKKWDKSACSSGDRCAKMDCHLPSTHFKLLGVFKEYATENFFESIMNYQGSCLWDANQLQMVENYAGAWPEDCQDSGVVDGSSEIYYAIKPTLNGNMKIGLYTDARCSIDYTGRKSADQILADDEDVTALISASSQWNSALDTFKICQPCKSYDLNYQSNVNNQRRLDEDAENDVNGGKFACNGGYVNQCAQFKEDTNMLKASFSDLNIATQQGTIMRANVNGITVSKAEQVANNYVFFIVSLVLFVLGLLAFIWAMSLSAKKRRQSNNPNSEPLVR